MRAGVMVMTLRKAKILPKEKPKLTGTKKARQVKSKVRSMLIISSHIKGIVHKEFILVGQAVNSAYYCYVLKLTA
jgi:hypothetical protein